MSDTQATPTTLCIMELKSQLMRQFQETTERLDVMLNQHAKMQASSIQDFLWDEEYLREREESMLAEYNQALVEHGRMIGETRDRLSELTRLLVLVDEDFMVRTTVVFSLETNCY